MTKKETPVVEVSAEDAAIIEAVMNAGGSVGEPGTLGRGSVVNSSSNADMPFPVVATEVTSAGYMYVYDRVTGDPSLVNKNNLAAILSKSREDGTRFFTTIDPGFRPTKGAVKCKLHKADPERERWDGMGLAICPKENLKTFFDLTRHMTRRHSQEWAIMNEEKDRKITERLEAERLEDRTFQKQLLELMAGSRT